MRPAPLALIAVAAAALGGLVALAGGKATGWVGGGGTTTVVVREATPAAADGRAEPAAVSSRAKPLAGNGFSPARIYAGRAAGVVTIFSIFGDSTAKEAAQGSGFVVSPKGYILTNSHVITNPQEPGDTTGAAQPASRVYVAFRDRDRVPARIVGWDIFDDVGLIKVDPKAHPLAPVPLGDSASVAVGAPVAGIGSPFGNENSLAVGVVSATHRSIRSLTSAYDLVDAIQTDAPLNHGNSGGPLFDARGRVIGISAQIRSDSGNAEGVGFAVPINSARSSMAQLIAKGHVAYAYVGIRTEDLTPSLARRFGYSVHYGAVIDSVETGYSGARAGLRGGTREREYNGVVFKDGGDLITAIDGQPVRSAEDVVRIVTGQLSPGDTATFTILRGAKTRAIPVKLDERPQNPAASR